MSKQNEWIDSLTLAKEADPRKEIMLFPFGEFEHPSYGKLKFDNKFFNTIIKNYEKKVLTTTPFMDVEHDMGGAVAWFNEVPFIRQNVGLFARPEYTSKGETLLKDKIYKYFSPWFGDYKDPQTGKEYKNVWRGGAATNVPFLKIMPPIIDDAKLEEGYKSVDLKLADLKYTDTQTDSDSGDGDIDETKSQTSGNEKADKNIRSKAMSENLRKILKLADDASDEEVEAKAEELVKESEAKEEEKPEEEKKEENEKEDSEETKELREKLNKVQMQLTEEKMNKVLDKALSEGKIVPADKKKWQEAFLKDPEGTENIIGLVKPAVDFTEKGTIEKTGAKMSEEKLMTAAEEILDNERKRGNQAITLSDCIIKARQKYPELGREYAKKWLKDTKFAKDMF